MLDPKFENRLVQPHTVRWFVPLLAVSVTYAVMRYHVLQGVEWAHFPLFIGNKAISLTAVLLVAASYLLGRFPTVGGRPPKKLVLVKFCGLAGFSLASVHAFASMLLLTPAYYPKLFDPEGALNFVGELSLMFGVLSLWALSVPAVASLPFMYEALGGDRWRRSQRKGYLALAVVAGHVGVMGVAGWMDPATWPGYLPPISLVAFIVALATLVIKLGTLMSGPAPERHAEGEQGQAATGSPANP